MFLRKIDFHRRRAIRQVHRVNKTGSGHWPRAVDRTRDDQETQDVRQRPKKREGQDQVRDGAQVEGDVVQADKERLDAARRELFAYRQPVSYTHLTLPTILLV